jgi:hypothetical protein
MLALLLPCLPLGACTGGPSSSTLGSDGGADENKASSFQDDAGGGATVASQAKKACEALIACVADVDPATAGALVTLYGDASNCWKGSASDAEACGKACAKSLEAHSECSSEPIDRHFLALCSSSFSDKTMRYDVALAFDARSGGQATFRPLPIDAQTYRSADALMTQPKVLLEIESGGGAGETSTPFDVPVAAFYADYPPDGPQPNVHVTRFAVERLRIEDGNVCSEVEATITSPYQTVLSGACVYLPLAENAAIASCTP